MAADHADRDAPTAAAGRDAHAPAVDGVRTARTSTGPRTAQTARTATAVRAGGAAVRGTARAGRATGRGAAAAWRGLRRLTDARGAGESGLARTIELHVVATIADTLIVTALATTVFFAVPTGQARGRVATSLLVTMVPFILLAPVIGPLLDRARHGRRYALATTMVVRAFLAWVMAGSLGGGGGSDATLGLYLGAFGFLVCQKAYIVTRAAALPRVLPAGTGLVAANSRISLAGGVGLAVGGGLGGGLTAWAGASWTLRLAFAVFAAGTALALRLPGRIDSDEGELAARISSTPQRDGPAPGEPPGDPVVAALARGGRTTGRTTGRSTDEADRSTDEAEDEPIDEDSDEDSDGGPDGGDDAGGKGGGSRRPTWSIGPAVVLGLRANSAVRAFCGFLTLFLAFRLRTEPLAGFSDSTSVVLVVALAAAGGALGNALGTVLGRIRPELAVVLVLVVTAAGSAWAAVAYGPWAVGAVALIAGGAQSLGKLCLDALIQREVPERVRASAFARSETVLQLAWVIGGAVGLALPLSGAWGLGLAALATTTASGLTATALVRGGRPRPVRRQPSRRPVR